MRDIKFRAWDKKRNRFVEYFSIENNTGRMHYNECNYIPFEDVDNFIIEQYTGLKDKNGVEIYEGDIVSHIDFEDVTKNHIVGNEDPHKWLQNEFWGYEGEMLIEPDEVEVIGNIHQSE